MPRTVQVVQHVQAVQNVETSIGTVELWNDGLMRSRSIGASEESKLDMHVEICPWKAQKQSVASPST